MNLRTVVLEYGADEFYWALVFVLKHSLVCTLIRARDVCQRHFYGEKKAFVHSCFTWAHAISHSEIPISHSWKGNHICRKSLISSYNFLCSHVRHAKELNGNSHKGTLEKLFSDLLLLEVRYAEWERDESPAERETVVTHGYIQTAERESPFPRHLLSRPPQSKLSLLMTWGPSLIWPQLSKGLWIMHWL